VKDKNPDKSASFIVRLKLTTNQNQCWVVNCSMRLKFYAKKVSTNITGALGLVQFIFVTSKRTLVDKWQGLFDGVGCSSCHPVSHQCLSTEGNTSTNLCIIQTSKHDVTSNQGQNYRVVIWTFYLQILSTDVSFYIYDRLLFDISMNRSSCAFNLQSKRIWTVKSEWLNYQLDGKYSDRVLLPAKVCPMVLLTWGHFSI